MTFSRSKSGSGLTRTPRQAWVLEPRMMFDAAAVTTAVDVAAHVAATETAPGVDATPVKATVTITDSSDSFTPIDLFSGVSVSADKDGQTLKDLVITVNRTGANQALVIDGKSIALESGSGTTRADSDGFSYRVTVSGDITTVTVNIDSFTDNLADTRALIDSIAYQPLDNTVAGGDVVVTLKSLSDEGGDDTDTADLNIHATVTIDSKINVAPVVSGETLLEAESLTTGTDVAYSADGKQAYIAGLDNTLAIFTVGESGHLTQKQSLTVENLGHVNHMVVSADGKSLYTISSNGNLMQFSLQNGTPSHTATISVGAGSNGGLAIADDGSQIYVDASSSYGREVFVYQRNTETGELTRTDSLRHRNGVIATAGEYVYIAHSGAIINDNHELQVYQRDSAGKLTLLGSISLEIKGQDPVDYAMAVSADGKSVYIANPKTNDITLYRVGSDNALTLVNTFSTPPVGSLVLNAEGTRLYAAATDGMVSVYAVSSTGALTLVGQAAGSTTGGDLALSQDGRSLLVAGEGVSRYSTLLTQIRGSDATIASGITLSDANFDALNAGNGNYGGMQLIVSRDGSASDKDIFNFSNTNDLRLENEQILQGDRAIATFSQSGGILTIAFLPGTSRAEANTVLHQVTYQNTDTMAGGSVVTLSLRANDGKVDSLPMMLAVLVTTNTAPILTVEAAPLSNYDTTATVVNVFTNTQITAGEAGQKILDVRLNIGGLKDAANEFLVIDGARIDLTQSNSGKTVSGYTYTYTLNDGSGTLEIHHATGMTMAAAQALLNDVAYTNETTQATAGIRTVTLVSLRDDGGVADQGVDTASLNVTATLTLAINNAPTIQTDIPVDPNLYYSDGLLTGYDSHVSSIVLSDDGRTLLVIGTTAANYGGDARVSLYQRDPDTGKLTLLQRLVPGTDDGDASNGTEVSGLIGRAAVFSDDGSTVYLSANSEVLVFSKNADTGMLGLTARVDGLAGNVLKLARSDDGKSLYALTAGTLYHYTIGDSGTLSNPATFTQVDGTTPIGLSVDVSGTVYVLGNSGKITIYTTAANVAVSYAGQLARGSDGVTLTYTDSEGNQKSAGTLATSNELNHANSAFTVTDEGYIYVVTSNVGNRLTVLHYDVAENTVSRVEALTFSNPWGVTASADGKTLYVGSNNGAVTVYAIGSDGKLTQTGTLAVGRPVTTLTLSEDGKSLYTGARFFNTGVMMSSAAAHAAYSQAVAMPFTTSITLSDQDLDVADDYKGATITVSRNGDASANDHFAFQNGGDLTLAGSSIQYQSATIATFNVSEGAVTIVFTESVTKTVVNQVLHQVTYRNEGDTAGSAISLKIGFSDGGKDTSLLLMMVPSKAPVVDNVEYTPPSATAGQSYTEKLPANLFRGPENGAMTWQVSGLPAGLTFDPETRTISGTPAINGAGAFAITVVATYGSGEQAEQTLTLTVASDPAQTPTIGGESSALQNDYAIDGYDSNSYVDVLSGVRDSQLSADGKTLYVVSSPESGSAVLSVFVRNEEGKFTLSKTFYNYRSVYNDETGQLDKIVDNAALAGASDVTLSADGQYLYVVGSEGNAVTLFRIDSDGELTQAGVLDQAALGGHSLDVRSHIVSQGDYLYLTAAQSGSDNDSRSVLVFKRGTDGTLTSVSQTDNLIEASRLVLDPTGRYLFVSGSGDTVGVTGFSIDAEGKLTQVSQIRAEGDDLYYINSLALSPDGKTLYAINADGIQYTLNTITVGADGALSLVATVPFVNDGGDTGEALATGLVVSADGTALFVIGKNISVFARAEDGSLTLKQTISGGWDSPLNISFSDLQNVELSADGKQLYLIGGDKVHVLHVGTAGATYTEDTDATVLLPSGRLSDPQLDALNEGNGDYSGASITVGRQEGGLPEDTFGFKADNGLTRDGDNVLKDGIAVATFTQVDGVLTVTFTASVTKVDAQNVLRQITYQNTSPDPEHAGSSPTFVFRINDGDNNVATMDVTVNLIGVNDPAVLTTTVLNPRIPGNGEFVKLFKDTHIDTIESGQTIWQVVLTFDVSGPNETISVDGSTIVLEKSNGTPRTASGLQYSVEVKDGKATVLLYVGKDGSGTAAIIDSIGYNYLGSDASGERHVTLMIKENNYSGSAPETTLEQAITLTLVPAAETNTAPVITIPGTTPTYTERADPIVLAPDATVSDAQMDKLNGGKGNYDGATLKITLGDGKTALDKLGFNAGNGLTLSGDTLQKDGVTIGQVSNKDGVLTIRFNANAGTIPTTEDVQNTLRQITYASDSHTPAAQVAVTVTLSDRYLESQVTALSVAVTAINDTPVVANDPVLSADELRLVNTYTAISGLGTVTAAARTTDGLALYVSDDKGAIALFQRDANSGELTYVRTFAAAEGVTGISQLQVSADGNSVYALRADGNAIVWFSRDANGELTHKATIASDYNIDNGNLNNIKGIALSDDGKNLYLINSYSDQLAYFSRDTATGALTYVEALGGDMNNPPYLWAPTSILSRGNLLFVTTDPSNGATVIVYQRDDSGKLTPLGHVRDFTDAAGNTVALSGLEQITVSADGRSVFVASAGQIDAFSLDTATGTFTHLARIAAEGTVSDIALSADARVLYVTKGDGAITRYVLNDNALIPLDTRINNGTNFTHLLPVDGGLIVLGNGVTVLDEAPRLPIYRIDGPAVIVAPSIVFSDAELDALNGGAGNYQGASITLQRGETASAGDRFDFTAGNGFTLANGVISKDGQAVATFTQAEGKLTVTFTAAISRADATALTRQISWATSAPLTGNSTSLTLVLNDGAADSAAQTFGVTLSREVNQPPVGHAELFTPPTAQVGTRWSYTLPNSLFSDAENDALTLSINGLPNGLTFDAATRTIGGDPAVSGTFNLMITATDSAGNVTALNVALTVNAASTPVDPGTPTEPVNPDNPTAAPVILVQQGVSLPVDSSEREREQPLGAIVADLSRPEAQALPTNIIAEPARQRDADSTRQSDAPWVLDPVMSQLMPTLDQVNFSSRASTTVRDSTAVSPADSNLFLSVRGQTTSLESAFSSVQGALQPDASGALAFSLPQRMFSVREGNATLTLQLANGRPLPAWVQFDARSGVVRITDASAVQVNQIQLALKAQAADGTSRIVPITLQTGQGAGTEIATDHGAMQGPANPTIQPAESRDVERLAPAGKTAFTEQLRQHQPEQDALLAALSELSSLRT